MMNVPRRSWRLARLAGCTVLALGLAGTAGAVSAPAQARVTATLTQYHLVASWGANGIGELGVAPHSSAVTRPVNAIGAGSGITQLAAGVSHMLALKSDGTVLSWGWNQSGPTRPRSGRPGQRRPGPSHRPGRRNAGIRRMAVQLRGPQRAVAAGVILNAG